MNKMEAHALLLAASARDGRAVRDEIAAVWADDLADVTVHEAQAAMREFYRERPDEWLRPGHILGEVRRARRREAREARIRRGPVELPPAPTVTLKELWEADHA
ncbi:hypothetical protein JRG19_02440 [Pseudoclavibacter alba]|uniref:hypothetical protein n=1 Tax=Pseudoclavibacter albus TaxID=272241 RepID=UPI0019D1EDA8|nr:hypothetical protein [Pseudoclavibacter alba]MBN6777409.1 hypothetical protein [Pseudoclavibacter alba]